MHQSKKDIGSLKEDVEANKKNLQADLDNFKSSTSTVVEELKNSITEAKSSETADVEKLRSEISQLETSVSTSFSNVRVEYTLLKSATASELRGMQNQLAAGGHQSSGSSADPSAPILQNEDILVQNVLNLIKKEYDARIDGVEKLLDEVAGDADKALNQAAVAHGYIPTVSKVKQTVSAFEQKLSDVQEGIKSLREQPSVRPEPAAPESRALSSHPREYNEATNSLRNDMNAEVANLQANVDKLEEIFKGFEARYQNISTGDMYQSMVHWITQNYPNAPDFLNKLQALEDEVRNIGEFVNRISWIQGRNKQLFSLAHCADAITQLLHDTERLGQGEQFASMRKEIETEAQTRARELEALRTELATERTSRAFANDLEAIHTLETRMNFADAANSELDKRVETAESAIQRHGQTLGTQEQSISKCRRTMQPNDRY